MKTADANKLKHVIESRQGLTAIFGDKGTGRSSLLRSLFEEYSSRSDCKAGFVSNPTYRSEAAFLRGICDAFRLPPSKRYADHQARVKAFLSVEYAAGRNVVLLIDDAEMLSKALFDTIHFLHCFQDIETAENQLQIVLAGSLDLLETLKEPSLAAVRRRIIRPVMLDGTTGD